MRPRTLEEFVGQTHLLGEGRLPGRTQLPSLALGASPPTALSIAAGRLRAGNMFLCSNGGIWFFAD